MEFDCQNCGEKVPGGHGEKDFQPGIAQPPAMGKNLRPFPGAMYYVMSLLSIIIALFLGVYLIVWGVINSYFYLSLAGLFPLSVGIVQVTHLYCVYQLAKRRVPIGFRTSPLAMSGLLGLDYHYLGWSGWFRVRRLARENVICGRTLLVQNLTLIPMSGVPVVFLVMAIVWTTCV